MVYNVIQNQSLPIVKLGRATRMRSVALAVLTSKRARNHGNHGHSGNQTDYSSTLRTAAEANGRNIPHPLPGMEADWHEIGRIAQALINRQFPGKTVLPIS